MQLSEVYDDLFEAKLVYARKGKQIVRKYRCGSGRLKGKTVSNPATVLNQLILRKDLLLLEQKPRWVQDGT